MAFYVKKPIPVEAIQWNGSNAEEIKEFVTNGNLIVNIHHGQIDLIIHTLEGDMRAPVGDYIIKGVEGEFYPCHGTIFEETYDLVNE